MSTKKVYKVSRNGKIENAWPLSNGKFLLPPGITNATVIAFSAEEYQDEEDFAPSTLAVGMYQEMFVSLSFMILSSLSFFALYVLQR